MGILNRIFGKQPEKRALTSWDLISQSAFSPIAVNERAAENLSVVLGCVNAVASTIASLPAYVYRKSGSSRKVDELHPLSLLIRDGVNRHQTWSDFIEWILASTLLSGNGLTAIERDERGIRALLPIPWRSVTISLPKTPDGSGGDSMPAVVYKVSGDFPYLKTNYIEGDVIHVKDRSDDGIVGRSRLSRAASVFRSALAVQNFSSSFFENGIRPSCALEVPTELTQDSYERLRQVMDQTYAGTSNAGRALILEQGIIFKGISLSAEDAELLGSRKFSGEELARIFDVPAPVVGLLDRATFSNITEQSRQFARSLIPWCRKIESEFQRRVFGRLDPNCSLEFDLSGLMRGSFTERWQSWALAVDKGILTAEEIRDLEGFDPLPAGSSAGSKQVQASETNLMQDPAGDDKQA